VDAVAPALSDNEFAACVSLAFNIGVGAFETSTLARYLKLGQKGAAATQFLLWDHQGGEVLSGLRRRRIAERALFLTPDA
jgi:lysozyme